MKSNKSEIQDFWDKKESRRKWGKIIFGILLFGFGLYFAIYMGGLYMKANNLTFVKFKINPEFGFIVNGNDEVVYYIPLNDDAISIYNAKMFTGLKTDQAIDKAVEVAKENNYLVDEEEKKIEVTVITKEEEEQEEVEEKIVNVIKKKDNSVVTEVVEATKEEKEIFKDIKIDKIDEVVSSVNKNTNINKNESVIQKCLYTKVSYENKSGDDRFKTAINVSKSLYKDNTGKNVILINSTDMVDGVISNSLASVLDASILFVNKDDITNETYEEIVRLGVEKAYIIGGAGVVSDKVVNKLKGELGIEVKRINGKDRFETSINVAKEVSTLSNTKLTSIIVAPVENDSVSGAMISGISGKEKLPIIYVNKDSIPDVVKQFISKNNIENIYVSGSLFSSKVINELDKMVNNIVKLGGNDRYETNASILNYFHNKFKKVVVVNNIVDSVVSARYAVKNNYAFIYSGNILSEDHINLINSNNVDYIVYFGGEEGKVVFRNLLYHVKKSNVSKCEYKDEELLFQNKHVVFYVPHQDDESSYFGQTILAAIDKLGSSNVHLVVFTKGNASKVYKGNEKLSSDDRKKYVNDDMLIKAGYVDSNGKASFMMARDAEFRKAVIEFGVTNYDFVEDLVGKKYVTHKDRFDDQTLVNNVDNVKNIMKYYDDKYNHDVTHITYTSLDAHSDHSTLGKCISELHFDTNMNDKSFENVFLIVKTTETHNIDSRVQMYYANKYKDINNDKENDYYTKQKNAFKGYDLDSNDDNMLGIGYKSASNVFNQFVTRMENKELKTRIHIPYKK